MAQGLYVTINSDDPPMFNTTLTNEYLVGQQTFDWDIETVQQFVLNAVRVTLLPETERTEMLRSFSTAFEHLMQG
jgi:adenosine deaminase